MVRDDPSGTSVWAELDRLINRSWPHRRAVHDLPVAAVAIDSGGHHTTSVYTFTTPRLARKVYAIKGRGGPGLAPWPQRVSKGSGALAHPVFVIGVDGLKDALAARLRLAEGPGRWHFPKDRDTQWFEHLTSETRFKRDHPYKAWAPRTSSVRCEVWDTTVYALAALHSLYVSGLRLPPRRSRAFP
ncbi:MAG: phage terminase GpA [Rhodospirillaceae bacterium]|nr:MAG: phage terminase GpA [Rhodospirillaceae bacterium]